LYFLASFGKTESPRRPKDDFYSKVFLCTLAAIFLRLVNSIAEAIRQGIRKLKEAELVENYQALVNNTRGLWKKGDGLAYQKKIRDEWNSQ